MKRILLVSLLLTALYSCKKDKTINEEPEFFVNEDAATFSEIGMLDIGEIGAAEISAFDPLTNKLFVVKNENEGTPTQDNSIAVVDFKNPYSYGCYWFYKHDPIWWRSK